MRDLCPGFTAEKFIDLKLKNVSVGLDMCQSDNGKINPLDLQLKNVCVGFATENVCIGFTTENVFADFIGEKYMHWI